MGNALRWRVADEDVVQKDVIEDVGGEFAQVVVEPDDPAVKGLAVKGVEREQLLLITDAARAGKEDCPQ